MAQCCAAALINSARPPNAKAARGFHTARRRDDGRAPSEELMARRRPRPTVREDNERALLEAAEWVFAEQGFAGATTAAIAQRARLPKANLHYYFADRKSVV